MVRLILLVWKEKAELGSSDHTHLPSSAVSELGVPWLTVSQCDSTGKGSI